MKEINWKAVIGFNAWFLLLGVVNWLITKDDFLHIMFTTVIVLLIFVWFPIFILISKTK